MKRWSADEDGYLDQTTTTALRLQPRYTDKPNGNCIESSDAAVESPPNRRAAVTPTIPAHHHLYWQATGARRHGNAASTTAVDC